MALAATEYLPNDRVPIGRLILFGFQHVLTMFPATILVALLCGFHTSTVLLAAGLATIVALTLSKNGIGTFIPLFYGSSFSYIAAYLGIAKAMNHELAFGVPAPDDLIALMQAGIVVSGIFNIIVGFFIKSIGKKALDRVLPPVVTGSVACVIGFGLAQTALEMSFTKDFTKYYWAIAFTTLIVTVAWSHLLQARAPLGTPKAAETPKPSLRSHLLQGRKLFGMLPVLFGAIAGYALTLVIAPDQINFEHVASAPWFAIPHLTWPNFSGPLVMTAVFSISIMTIATIPESTAHLYQMSLYVDKLAQEQGKSKVFLDSHVGVNLICDGVGDVICGVCGGTAGTNYGENNSLMVITRNYSGRALFAAGVICLLLAFVGKFAALVGTVPVFVSGGLAVYLFGAIGMQGIALITEKEVDLVSDPLQLAIGATIMVIGIGGNIGYPGGLLPIIVPGIFPSGLPAIATAAFVGVVMHLALSWYKPAKRRGIPSQVPTVKLDLPRENSEGISNQKD